MIAKQAQAGGIQQSSLPWIARPARVLAILVSLVACAWGQSPGGERNDAKRNERVGELSTGGLTLTPSDPSFCVGSTCPLADMLNDSSLTVDTLTVAELARLHAADDQLTAATRAHQSVIDSITTAHGAHTHTSLIGGCTMINLQNGNTPAPTTVPNVPVDDSWMDVTVVIRGKYAFRVKRIPPSMCNISWAPASEPIPLNHLPVTY